MNLEDSISLVGRKFDALWDDISTHLDPEDQAALMRATLEGIKLVKEYERIKTEAVALVATFLNLSGSIPQEERDASLVQGFATAAKIKGMLRDEMKDVEVEMEIAIQMDAIARALDEQDNRSALVGLLHDADARVRASAGAYLLSKNLASDLAVPVLRKIENDEFANNAHFVASFALFRWEVEGKAGPQS